MEIVRSAVSDDFDPLGRLSPCFFCSRRFFPSLSFDLTIKRCSDAPPRFILRLVSIRSLVDRGLSIDKERIKASDDGGRSHAPHDHRDGPRHDGGHLVGKHGGEQGGEEPDRHLEPLLVALVGPLELSETPEQGDEVGIGDDDEGQGPEVVNGPVGGGDAIISQECKAQKGDQ